MVKVDSSVDATASNQLMKPKSSYRWTAVLLCSGAVTINYIDRVNIGVAAPTLMNLFSLSPAQMGILMSAFFWSYVACLMPAGWILNRIGPKLVMFYSCLGWGLATMLTSVVSGFNSFFAVRVALGLTEAPAYPASVRVVSVWIPARERTLASAAFDCCARVGNAFAPPIVAYIIVTWGWKMSFIVTGLLAVVYSFIWLVSYKEPDDHPKVTASELAYIRQNEVVDDSGKVVKTKIIPIMQLFTYPKVLLACIGMFLYMYFWTTFNMWIPAYLVKAKGLDLKAMGIAAMYPYIAGVILELVGGYVFDKWHHFGASISQLRRVGMGIGMVGAAITLYWAVTAETSGMTILWLTASMGIFSFGASNVWAIPNDIAPYGQGGGVAGVYNTIGNMGSLIGPMATGFIVSSAWGYDGALLVMCVSSFIGALCYMTNTYTEIVPKN